MKNINIHFILIGFIAIISSNLFLSSCDDSFLETKAPDYYETTDTLFVTNATLPFSVNMDFNENEICNWRLAQFPAWLDIYPKEGTKGANANSSLNLAVKDGEISVGLGFYTFPLVFDIDGEKMIGYTVVLANLGHPTIEVSSGTISFTNTFNSTVEISNTSYGILNWWIADAPNWVKWNKANDLLDQYQSESINFSADVNGMDPGEYNGTIKIQSNAENYPVYEIQVSLNVTANAYYGSYHEGQLVDSRYSKNRDEVIVLTKTPNQLLFFSSNVDAPEIVELDRVPQCLALSEDESKIAIGYSNSEITTYNAQNHNPITTYLAGTIPLNLEFGNSDWLYFIASKSYENYLNSLNLTNREITRSENGEGGLTTLLKVPNKDLLVAYRPGYSPDGMFLFDISESGETNKMNEYFMSHGGIWFTDDGEKFLTAWNKIYNMPAYNPNQSFFTEEPPITGQFEVPNSQMSDCLAQQSSSDRIFSATGFGWSGLNTVITIFNDHTLVQQKSIELKFLRPENFSVYSTWTGRPKAMYPSENKKDLWLVQKYVEYDTNIPGIWSVTKIDISK